MSTFPVADLVTEFEVVALQLGDFASERGHLVEKLLEEVSRTRRRVVIDSRQFEKVIYDPCVGPQLRIRRSSN